MKIWHGTLLLALAAVIGAGCSGSSRDEAGGNLPVLSGLHAVSDMGAITLLRDEVVWSHLQFAEATDFRTVDPAFYAIDFDTLLPSDDTDWTSCRGDLDADGQPGANECTRLGSVSLNMLRDREYTVAILGRYGDHEILVYDKPFHEFDFDNDDETELEVQFFHLAPVLGEVDVYLEAPGASPSPAQARGTLSLKESFHTLVAQGDYVLSLTAVADPATPFFTSDTFRLDRRTRVVFAIRDGAGHDTSEVVVTQHRDRGATLLDRHRETELRITHAAPRIGNVDVYAANEFLEPFAADMAFEETSAYERIHPSNLLGLDLAFTPAGDPGVFLARERINLNRGERATFFLLGTPERLEGLKSSDQFRRLATHARIRLINGATQGLDYYVVDQGANITTLSPTAALSFRNSSGFLRFDPGTYDIVMTLRGTSSIAFGPLTVELEAGGVYTIVGTATGESSTADVVLLDDFKN
jgi:hypothetical protein